MWSPYIEVIKLRAPQATLVFDRLHIVQHLLRVLHKVRAPEARAIAHANPQLLARTKFLFLRNAEKLSDAQRDRLIELERSWSLKTCALLAQGSAAARVELQTQSMGQTVP